MTNEVPTVESRSSTKSEKAKFANGQEGFTSVDALKMTLDEYEMVPDEITVYGRPGTGMAIVSGDRVVSAVRHPSYIPNFKPGTFEFANGYPEYYGTQSEDHMATSMAESFGVEYSRKKATELVEHIRKFGFNGIIQKTGFATVGMEEENLHFDRATGKPRRLPDEEQFELQDNVKEIAFSEPATSIYEQAMQLAESRKSEADANPDTIINSTSFSLISEPDEMRMNSGVLGQYINAVAFHMFENYFDPSNETARGYWDNISKNAGYDNFEDMKAKVNDLTPLSFVAAHVSLGLRSENVDGSYRVGLEEGIAVADMVNSNFGTLLEWMTYSTPLAYGEKVGVEVDGEMKYPRDARAIARLASRTAYPGDFIMTPDNYKNRVVEAMVEGQADRIDRSGFIAYHEDRDEKITNPHARARFRVAPNEGKNKFDKRLGRVEFVGGGNTPDLTALMSRNAMYKLMALASYEAVAHGQHPVEYFKYVFPSMSTCEDQINVAYSYNLGGPEDPQAAALVEEGRSFIEYMRRQYPNDDIGYVADLAEMGLDKLIEKTEARTLEEYMTNSKGNVSDVINHMHEDGYTALEIAIQVSDFEKKQSEKVIEYGGDVLKMVQDMK